MQVTQVIGTTSRPLDVLGAGGTEPRVASTSQPVAADPPKKCPECHGTSECQDCAPKGSGMNGNRVCGGVTVLPSATLQGMDLHLTRQDRSARPTNAQL